MRTPRLPLAFSFCLLTAACGVVSPRAVAEPRKAEEALIRAAFDTEAEVARAIREYYTKYEFRIPMRDGVKLFTIAYVPKDASRTYPIMLQRTP